MCVQGDNLRSDWLAFLTSPLSSQDVESSEETCPAPFHAPKSSSEAPGCLQDVGCASVLKSGLPAPSHLLFIYLKSFSK